MTEYEALVRSQVQDFAESLREEFAGQYDYIEGFDSDSSDGLGHLKAYEDGVFDENPLKVRIAFPGIDQMSMGEFETLDENVHSTADESGVTVEATGGAGGHVEYTFYLHASFLDVAP